MTKVRTLASLGMLSALWMTYASASTFGWGVTATTIFFLPVAIPAVVLWKIQGMLASAVGLPQRIVDAARRLHGKAVEYRNLAESRPQRQFIKTPPTVRELWKSAKSILELKAMGDEAGELVSVAGGALIMANPVFVVVMTCTTAITALMVLAGAIVAIAYLV